MTLRLAILTCLALLTPLPAYAADEYTIDKSHTHLLFYVNHLGFSDMIGDFTEYNGNFTFDEKKPETSTLDMTIYPKGIRTSSSELDKYLQEKDFFNTEKFPEIRFVSTSVKVTGKRTGDVTGNLTMLGVTKPVVLHVTFNKADYHAYSHMYTAGFSGSATLKRSDFGMTYGLPDVSDEVRLEVQLEATNQTRKKAEAIHK